jgi:D-beta-D-heptose 7-phosphate kinase/D-beta-D-heptose 1-phosphate adenosyltransferase
VVLFDAETPIELIRAIRPDVLAKGADYSEDAVVGAADVKSWGGQVVLVPLVDDRSTSAIIQRMRPGLDSG